MAVECRFTSVEAAISRIQSGDHVYVGSACATPRVLINALENGPRNLENVELFHFLTYGAVSYRAGGSRTRFQHRCFFVGTDDRDIWKQGKADYVPISITHVPSLIENGRIPVDVALIQVSRPDEYGYVSLGVSVDITKSVLKKAKIVIAEMNRHMPFTMGDSFLHLNDITHVVQVDRQIIEYVHPPIDAVGEQIARYVARIIEDGATLQIGLGRIPNGILNYLTNRRDIGIHSDLVTEPIVDLIDRGVVTGTAKGTHRGQVVASYCMGTRRLYDVVDKNRMFSFHPLEYVCNPSVISANPRFVAITQAFSMDLTGQVCAEQLEGDFYGGISTQPEFLRAAAVSPGGKAIICLQSASEDGRESRIRPLLCEGESVTITRSDVHYVVTEYGVAYLFGKSIRERALSLIEIAHPSFRDWLFDEARRLGYVGKGQTLKSKGSYPIEEEREITLKDETRVVIRPSRASDAEAMQELLYSLSHEDRNRSFLQRFSSLQTLRASDLCNVDHDREVTFLAITGGRENEQIIGVSCYYVDKSTNLAEVAYIIRPEWQKRGLGRALQRCTGEHAKRCGLRGFVGQVPTNNVSIIGSVAKDFQDVFVTGSGEVYEITMLF